MFYATVAVIFITLAKHDFSSFQSLLCVCFLTNIYFVLKLMSTQSLYLLVLTIVTLMLPPKIEIVLRLLFPSFNPPCNRKVPVRLRRCIVMKDHQVDLCYCFKCSARRKQFLLNLLIF